MIVSERYLMVRSQKVSGSLANAGRSDESEKCTLSALCVLFDNRSAAGTPSLAALQLSLPIPLLISIDIRLGLIARNCAFMIEVQRGRARKLCLPSVS